MEKSKSISMCCNIGAHAQCPYKDHKHGSGCECQCHTKTKEHPNGN